MKISHGTRLRSTGDRNGYGYATDRMLNSLHSLGYEISQNDPTADVQIWFDQPQHWTWNASSQYRIGYLPWESTRLLDGWQEKLDECDEVWTPSPLIAQWFRDLGTKPPVYVYEHGVDPIWTTVDRPVDDKIRFLHMGAEAARKGGIETMRAFRNAFTKRTDVELSLKMINPGWNVPQFGTTNILNYSMDLRSLVQLFHEHHVYVYPSWGEGFGLTPLQALVTGMPTITVPAWAPYRQFLDRELSLRARLVRSPWHEIHPGKMFMPSTPDLISRMRYAADNYDQIKAFALARTDQIRKEYDWNTRTKDAFDALEKRLGNS